MKYAEWILATFSAAMMLGLIAFVAALAVSIHQRGGCIEHAKWRLGGDATFVAVTYCSKWSGESR